MSVDFTTLRILLVQEMTGWQWHQLDHMQIICTSLQTHNHASTSLQMMKLKCKTKAIDKIERRSNKLYS